jgi:hypothetical protein
LKTFLARFERLRYGLFFIFDILIYIRQFIAERLQFPRGQAALCAQLPYLHAYLAIELFLLHV